MMTLTLDATSLLVDVDATMTLGDLESELADRDVTLGLRDLESHRQMSVATWLGEGAPGSADPWLDPADHLLAGLEMRLSNGAQLAIRSAPRRAVGPDLIALAFGTRGRFGTIVRASLRIQRKGVPRPETEPFTCEHNPPINEGEARLFAAIERELAR
jgi:alkyldihydroxyacetonephosphate synthase